MEYKKHNESWMWHDARMVPISKAKLIFQTRKSMIYIYLIFDSDLFQLSFLLKNNWSEISIL